MATSNLPAPFHVYSMRQAIEEGFILDVLKNYTPYRLAFRLANNGKEWDDKEVERDAALKGIMRWVRLHPYNISQKVQIVVEHFRENVAPLLDGRAKAMVVLGSRVEAVRWQLAIEKYIKSRGYKIGTLVAFSGEVNDSECGPDAFTETSKALNPDLNGRDIRDAFKGDELSNPAGGEQIPDRVRSAAALRHVCGPASCWHSGRADALAAQPGPSRQGHDLRARLRQQLRGGPGRVQDLLRHGRTGGRHRPEPRLRSASQARCVGPLRRL